MKLYSFTVIGHVSEILLHASEKGRNNCLLGWLLEFREICDVCFPQSLCSR